MSDTKKIVSTVKVKIDDTHYEDADIGVNGIELVTGLPEALENSSMFWKKFSIPTTPQVNNSCDVDWDEI